MKGRINDNKEIKTQKSTYNSPIKPKAKDNDIKKINFNDDFQNEEKQLSKRNSEDRENNEENDESIQNNSIFITLSDSDIIFEEAQKQKEVFDCSPLIEKSELNKTIENKKVLCIPLNENCFIVLFGDELGDSIYSIENFAPTIKIAAYSLSMNDPQFVNILQTNKICLLPDVDDVFDIKKQISSLSIQESLSFGLTIFKEFKVDQEIARNIMKKAIKMCKSTWSRCLECFQFMSILLKKIGLDLFGQKGTSAILVSSLFWILTDANDATNAQIAFGTDPDFKVKLFHAAEACRKAGVPLTDLQFWKYLRNCFNGNSEKEYEDIEGFNPQNENHRLILASLLCRLCEYRRYFILYETEDEIDKATTFSVMNEVVYPIYDKLSRHISCLKEYQQQLNGLKEILKKRDEATENQIES